MSHADEVDVEILKQLKAMERADRELDEEGVYAQCGRYVKKNDTRTKRNGQYKDTTNPL